MAKIPQFATTHNLLTDKPLIYKDNSSSHIEKNSSGHNQAGDFFECQTAPLMLTEDNNTIMVIRPDAEPPASKQVPMSFFVPDGKGNLRINYCTIDKQLITYDTKAKNRAPRIWFQTRWNRQENKYTSPKDQPTYPFFPPLLLNAFEEKREIETIYITEGAKKAWVGCLHNMPVVGLTSVFTYKDGETKKIHNDIKKLILECKVQNVVILWDADCLNISEKDLSIGSNVGKRPWGFYAAAKNITDLVHDVKEDIRVYFSHVKFNDPAAKGLDDLLSLKDIDVEEVVKEAMDIETPPRKFFGRIPIHADAFGHSDLKEYFGINSPDRTWENNKAIIRDQSFNFSSYINGTLRTLKYRWNGKELESNDPFNLEEQEEFWKYVSDGKSTKLRFVYQNSRIFLRNKEFWRYKINTVTRFVHCNSKVVRQVDSQDVKNFVARFAEEGNYADGQVLEMVLRAGHQYFGDAQLSFMYPFEGDFLQPEPGVQRIFFKNGFWEITADGISVKSLDDLPGYIWESQVIDFEPTIFDNPLVQVGSINGKFGVNVDNEFSQCHIGQFLLRTSSFDWEKYFELKEVGEGKKRYELRTDVTAMEQPDNTNSHFVAKMLAIGYLIYSYRDKSQTRAIVCMDGIETEVGTSDGGTGKSIFGQIAGHVVPSVTIDGKKRNLTDDKFIYQEVDERTQVLFFDDCRTNLDFEHFFSQITNKIDVEGKSIPKYSLPAPKFIFTTNHAINGEGNSFERRQFLLSFSNWYNQYRTPKDDFGCVLFDDWDSHQWNLFYNFIACCVQAYLKFGFNVKIDTGDLLKRKLRQQMGEVFLDWADLYYMEDVMGNLDRDCEKQELYEDFLGKHPNERKYTDIRKFKAKLKKFCEYKGFKFNPKQNGKDDKRSGKEYITISK